MRIVERPNTRAELRQHTGGNAEGYATVVGAISFFDAVGDTQDEFERRLCRSVVGESEGIQDIAYNVVGNMGDTLFVRVRGYIDPAVLELSGSGD